MNRRTALFAPLLLAALASPVMAAPISLADLSSYLNGISTAESDFTQVNADGSISTGKIYIRRPGRVRFEYAPPDNNLVIASAGSVTIFDARSNQAPERYPLNRTPLNLILAQTVDLGRANMVMAHGEVEGTTRVRAQDPANPEYGSIELVFTANPTELRQWIITDDMGSQTTVILGEMTKGGSLPAGLFDHRAEMRDRN